MLEGAELTTKPPRLINIPTNGSYCIRRPNCSRSTPFQSTVRLFRSARTSASSSVANNAVHLVVGAAKSLTAPVKIPVLEPKSSTLPDILTTNTRVSNHTGLGRAIRARGVDNYCDKLLLGGEHAQRKRVSSETGGKGVGLESIGAARVGLATAEPGSEE